MLNNAAGVRGDVAIILLYVVSVILLLAVLCQGCDRQCISSTNAINYSVTSCVVETVLLAVMPDIR